MRKLTYILSSLLAAALLAGCSEKPTPEPEPPITKKNRTVLVYMVADNSLYAYGVRNINEMEAAWDEALDGHLAVYFYPVAGRANVSDFDPRPRLLLISRDAALNDSYKENINSRVLKYYDRAEDPTDPLVMARVIADARELAPANTMALDMWSHGSGWISKAVRGKASLKSEVAPYADRSEGALRVSKLEGLDGWRGGGMENGGAVVEYSFGESLSHGSTEMQIDDMARALPAGEVFDFILFDACHMASVEVAWELKDHARYLLGSAAETLASGFPYQRMMAKMFARQPDVVGMATDFYNSYNGQSGVYQSGTVAVVDCGQLQGLAEAVADIASAGLPAAGFSQAAQQYGRSRMGFGDVFYDLGGLVRKTWTAADPAKLAAFEEAMARAVPYAASTPWLFRGDAYGDIQVDLQNYTGLSCYLPRLATPRSLEEFRTYGWSRVSRWGDLLP